MPVIDVEPGFTGERHPDLFALKYPRSSPLKPGQLTDEQLRQFYEEGYVVVSGIFEKELLQQCRDEIDALVEELALLLHQHGKIENLYRDHGFKDRLTLLEKDFPGANIILHSIGKMTPGFHKTAQHPLMLNLLEDILGPDISFNPVWNLRTKTPKNAPTTVPWHQDNAYMDNESYKIMLASAWIPLVDANADNGTMQYIRRTHKDGFVATHVCCAGPTWYVEMDESTIVENFKCDLQNDVMTIHVPVGSFILFNNFIVHRSMDNRSDMVRWSLDFRWQAADSPAGLWNMKQAIPLRLKENPDLVADWITFDSVHRTKETMNDSSKKHNELITVITGPWMKKWKIVQHNAHTETFLKEETHDFDPNMIHV